MPHRRRLLALVAALALLAPGAAFAQNPGDEQYSDPLAPNEQPGGGGQGGGGGGGSSGSGTTPPSDSGAEAGSAQGGEEQGTPSQGAGAGGSGELPRTGLPAGVMALIGGAMLAAGAALRRRVT